MRERFYIKEDRWGRDKLWTKACGCGRLIFLTDRIFWPCVSPCDRPLLRFHLIFCPVSVAISSLSMFITKNIFWSIRIRKRRHLTSFQDYRPLIWNLLSIANVKLTCSAEVDKLGYFSEAIRHAWLWLSRCLFFKSWRYLQNISFLVNSKQTVPIQNFWLVKKLFLQRGEA